MAWNPAQYLKFQSARLRPALDLLSRTTAMVSNPQTVTSVLDLGCGPGNISPYLAEAFPNAMIDGVDSSPEMIQKANQSKDTLGALGNRMNFRVNTIEGEVSQKIKKYDVIYANASLHWCLHHEVLFPQMIKELLSADGGVLAIQMPDTRVQPSHVLMETAALRRGLSEKIKDVRIPRTEQDPLWYYQVMIPCTKEIDLWSTNYVEPLTMPTKEGTPSRHPVHEFTRSTGLMPVVQALGGESDAVCQDYLAEYDRLLHEAYPVVDVKNDQYPEGKKVTLLEYKRFFLVCKS
jgi:trans-aconitate 2-methyltransferase